MKITYLDKVAIQNDESIPDINKVTDADMNEIKRVVNNNEEELKTENERLRQDLNGLPKGQVEGEKIDLTDSADMRFSSFEISGNSKQETVTDNLFNNIWEQGLIASETGANVESTTMIRSDYTKIYPNHLYNIARSIYSSYMSFRFYDKDKNYLGAQTAEGMMTYSTSDGRMNENESSMTFTILNENVAYMRVTDGSNNLSTKYTLTTEAINPDYPSEVEACGDNINLFDKDKANTLGVYFTSESTTLIQGSVAKSLYIPITSGKTYSVSKVAGERFNVGTTEAIPNANVTLIDNAKNFNTNETMVNSTKVILKTSSNAKYLVVLYYASNADTLTEQEILDSIKIVEGSETGEYSKYGQGCINEVICNKNILDYDKTSYGFYNSSSIFEGAKVHRISDFIKAESNKQYIASTNRIIGYLYIYEFDINKNLLKRSALTNVKENLITTINSTKYIRVSYNIDNHIEMTIDKLKEIEAQLEKDSISTEYEEHKEQVFTIPTQQPKRSIEIEKDTFIRDTFIMKNNKRYERNYIYRKIFNGTEEWTLYGEGNNRRWGFLVSGNIPLVVTTTDDGRFGIGVSSHFEVDNSYQKNDLQMFVQIGGGSWYAGITDFNSKWVDVNSLKTWLSEQYNAGTPVYIDYVLATPIDIECTEEQTVTLDEIDNTAKTYKGTTHIYSTDNVGTNKEVRYFKDIEIMMNK